MGERREPSDVRKLREPYLSELAHRSNYDQKNSIQKHLLFPRKVPIMDEEISKSQKKRDAEFLQKIGVDLVGLSLAKLDVLPLTDTLYKAIVDAKSIKSHGAKKRQAQLIGKQMRAANYEEILAAYHTMLAQNSAVSASFQKVELWRDRLIHEGKEALTEFIEVHSPTEVQSLRHLIKKAQEDQQKEKNTGAAKALFRYLRPYIV